MRRKAGRKRESQSGQVRSGTCVVSLLAAGRESRLDTDIVARVPQAKQRQAKVEAGTEGTVRFPSTSLISGREYGTPTLAGDHSLTLTARRVCERYLPCPALPPFTVDSASGWMTSGNGIRIFALSFASWEGRGWIMVSRSVKQKRQSWYTALRIIY